MTSDYRRDLEGHYEAVWGTCGTWYKPPTPGRPFLRECSVLEFAPTEKTFCWVYATCGMTELGEREMVELFLLSPEQKETHVELLASVAHYHQTGAEIGLGDTVNFGRGWFHRSRCSFGLISLPYTFGPQLEHTHAGGREVRVLWLVPITPEERALKVAEGVEALEQLFEAKQFDYLDPGRVSVSG